MGRMGHLKGELGPKIFDQVPLTRCPNLVELSPSFFRTQAFKCIDRGWLAEVVAKNGDVDVFGKSLNQAEGFRQGCSALEQQARRTGRSALEQRIERPAHPKVLLDVLLGRSDPPSGRDEQIATIAGR